MCSMLPTTTWLVRLRTMRSMLNAPDHYRALPTTALLFRLRTIGSITPTTTSLLRLQPNTMYSTLPTTISLSREKGLSNTTRTVVVTSVPTTTYLLSALDYHLVELGVPFVNVVLAQAPSLGLPRLLTWQPRVQPTYSTVPTNAQLSIVQPICAY